VSRNGPYFVTSLGHYLEQYFRGMKVYVMRNNQPGAPAYPEEPGNLVRVNRLEEVRWGIAIKIQ
jgi:hypothetical protein